MNKVNLYIYVKILNVKNLLFNRLFIYFMIILYFVCVNMFVIIENYNIDRLKFILKMIYVLISYFNFVDDIFYLF